jgi:hypothetical protein
MRLPEPMTVDGLKRYMDRRFLTKRGFRREMKRELRRFATKDDLKALATKDELNDLRRTMLALHQETMNQIRELRRDLLYIVDNHEKRLLDLEGMRRV